VCRGVQRVGFFELQPVELQPLDNKVDDVILHVHTFRNAIRRFAAAKYKIYVSRIDKKQLKP